MIDWWKLVWLMLTAGVANMVPPLVIRLWPKWNNPIDMGKSWNGKRIFGDHKTVRGLVCGVVVAEVVFLILRTPRPWYLGALLGLGSTGR